MPKYCIRGLDWCSRAAAKPFAHSTSLQGSEHAFRRRHCHFSTCCTWTMRRDDSPSFIPSEVQTFRLCRVTCSAEDVIQQCTWTVPLTYFRKTLGLSSSDSYVIATKYPQPLQSSASARHRLLTRHVLSTWAWYSPLSEEF